MRVLRALELTEDVILKGLAQPKLDSWFKNS